MEKNSCSKSVICNEKVSLMFGSFRQLLCQVLQLRKKEFEWLDMLLSVVEWGGVVN